MKPLLVCALALSCSAATTQTWEMNGYSDFVQARMSGLTLSRDGRLAAGPKLETLFDSGQAEIWAVAQGPDGSLYLGTGNRGKLYRVEPSGKSALLWTADQPEIFAVAVDAKGVVYAGTSPDGKIYRIEKGKATEYFAPGARYIWALTFSLDGSLYAATGDQGKIFRITGAGQGSVYYETGQTNVTCLAFDQQGRLLAGSDPNGILYRVTAPGQAFVLYDANFPEIRTVVPAPDGTVYAAALGGSVARRVGAALNASGNGGAVSLPSMSTSITVTDQQAGGVPAPKADAVKPIAPVAQAPVIATSSPVEVTGVDRSALYRIQPDNTVETLWSSKEENIYDFALDGASMYFLTDARGRIYKLDNDRKTTLAGQTNEGDALRLIPSPAGLIAATGNLGRLVRLGNQPGAGGWIESPVHDAGTVARWGRISWRGAGKSLVFRTRTGNSMRPDPAWSAWSEPISNPERANVSSPNARYIQWRSEFASPDASLDNVGVAYLPQNTPPVVRSISVSAQSSGKPGAAASPSSSANAAYSITVTDTGDSSSAVGTPSQTISRGASQQVQISWQADDPDGDKLIYNLYFRGEDESEWKMLRGHMTENTYALESDVLADGRYFFRVSASDRLSNAAELARETDLVSAPVVIDNTPPVVTVGRPRKSGSAVEIDVDAADKGSALRRCEYSVDAGPWSPVEAVDGVTDAPTERFLLHIEGLPAGEHLVVVRVYDSTGNAGLAKVVVK